VSKLNIIEQIIEALEKYNDNLEKWLEEDD